MQNDTCVSFFIRNENGNSILLSMAGNTIDSEVKINCEKRFDICHA